MLVVDQRDQQMFEGRILVPALAGLPQGIVEGLFEFASETRHLGYHSPPAEEPTGLRKQCHTHRRGNQGAGSGFSPDYREATCARGELRLLEKLFGGGAVGFDALDVRFDARDLGLQGGDALVKLVDRDRIEVLLGKRDQGIVGLAREEFVEVHGRIV
jgi:hypothetical protein